MIFFVEKDKTDTVIKSLVKDLSLFPRLPDETWKLEALGSGHKTRKCWELFERLVENKFSVSNILMKRRVLLIHIFIYCTFSISNINIFSTKHSNALICIYAYMPEPIASILWVSSRDLGIRERLVLSYISYCGSNTQHLYNAAFTLKIC